MTTTIRKEVRKRGFFGWLFLLLFLGFNALMVLWLVNYGTFLAGHESPDDAARIGKAIGGAMGVGMIIFIWLAGAVILGLFALLTRGRKTIVTETTQ